MNLRTQAEIQAYEQKLEAHYLSDARLMTDVELHNVNVRIGRAIAMYRNGVEPNEIRGIMAEMELDPEASVKLSPIEIIRNEIQSNLLARGYVKGTEEFVKREDKLLLKWLKRENH